MTWPNAGANNKKFLENIITQNYSKKIMVEDNFWKCSTWHSFSEIFQCVINRRICRGKPDSKPFYERKI